MLGDEVLNILKIFHRQRICRPKVSIYIIFHNFISYLRTELLVRGTFDPGVRDDVMLGSAYLNLNILTLFS